MRQIDTDVHRSLTPPVLWRGLEYGPALVVLDPVAGIGRPEVPGTWRKLAERYQVAWCRIPDGSSSLHRVEDVLETLAERDTPTSVIADAGLAEQAARVAAEFRHVHTVLLVGDSSPAPRPRHAGAPATGVVTRLLAAPAGLGDEVSRDGSPRLRHPAVVRELTRVLEAPVVLLRSDDGPGVALPIERPHTRRDQDGPALRLS